MFYFLDTFKEWHLGQRRFFPIPLNSFPQSLHTYSLIVAIYGDCFQLTGNAPDKCSCMKRNVGIIPYIINPGKNHCSSCRRRVFFIRKRVFYTFSVASYVPRTRIIVDYTVKYPNALPYYFVRIWRNNYGSMNIAYLK